jgi:hypothetical protein
VGSSSASVQPSGWGTEVRPLHYMFLLSLKLHSITELSILIAMRSRLYPSMSMQNHGPFVPINLNLALAGSMSSPEAAPDLESECWGEESYIELAAVQLRTDGVVMSKSPCFSFQSSLILMVDLTQPLSLRPYPRYLSHRGL